MMNKMVFDLNTLRVDACPVNSLTRLIELILFNARFLQGPGDFFCAHIYLNQCSVN
jgi:hypothetical protein